MSILRLPALPVLTAWLKAASACLQGGGTKIARAVQRQQELLADVQRRFQAMYGGGVVAVSEQDGSLDTFVGTLQTRSDDVGGGPRRQLCPVTACLLCWSSLQGSGRSSRLAVMLEMGHNARSALGRSACHMSVAACTHLHGPSSLCRNVLQ